MSERPLDKVAYLYGLGKRAEMLRNGGTVMRGAGRSSVTLAKANGEKTRAGVYYEEYFGETLPKRCAGPVSGSGAGRKFGIHQHPEQASSDAPLGPCGAGLALHCPRE